MTSCEEPGVHFFASCSPTRALLNGLWQQVMAQCDTKHPKTLNMKAVCDEEELFLKEHVYLSRAEALTKWQGQHPTTATSHRPPWSTCTALYWWPHLKNFLCSTPTFVSAIAMNLCLISLFQFERRQDYLRLKSVFIPELQCIVAHSELSVLFLP